MIMFCEYVVPDSDRATFMEWTAENQHLWQGAELMENVGQPGVFVEIWPIQDEEEGARAQKERLGGRSKWRDMDRFVKGGSGGVRIWLFRKAMYT